MDKQPDLKRLRYLLGESPDVFAARFGVNRSTIFRWQTAGLPKNGPGSCTVELALPKIMNDIRARTQAFLSGQIPGATNAQEAETDEPRGQDRRDATPVERV